MKLLANENIPLRTVRALRSAGEDVLSITESSPGMAYLPRLHTRPVRRVARRIQQPLGANRREPAHIVALRKQRPGSRANGGLPLTVQVGAGADARAVRQQKQGVRSRLLQPQERVRSQGYKP